MGPHVHPERGRHRQVLLRPRHRRILQGHLENLAGQHSIKACIVMAGQYASTAPASRRRRRPHRLSSARTA